MQLIKFLNMYVCVRACALVIIRWACVASLTFGILVKALGHLAASRLKMNLIIYFDLIIRNDA